MKLGNFLSLDMNSPGVGLSNSSRFDKLKFNKYLNNVAKLIVDAEKIAK